jgi:hypothetical protein
MVMNSITNNLGIGNIEADNAAWAPRGAAWDARKQAARGTAVRGDKP